LDEPNALVDTISLIEDDGAEWVVGDINHQLKLSLGRPFPAFEVLSNLNKSLMMKLL